MNNKTRLKPTKTELAEMKVLNNLGHSPSNIAKTIGRSHNTVLKYLRSDIYENPELQELVRIISEKELQELTVIGSKARACQHKYLDAVLNGEKEVNPIAVTAIGDRGFQQRRLLAGDSTCNLDLLHQSVIELETIREQATNLVKKLRGASDND
jgi:hypothetical protein